LKSIATGSIGALIEEVRFAADSSLEEGGFEPLVPLCGELDTLEVAEASAFFPGAWTSWASSTSRIVMAELSPRCGVSRSSNMSLGPARG
jgi:hypothetical protein